MMPGVDGYEVCRRVREKDGRVPVLFLSAKSEEIDVVVGLRLGADDFVRKPFGKHELIARIHSALRRVSTAKTPSACFEMGVLRVFPDELRAQRGEDASVDLTPREVALLKLLHERRGQALSRDVFLDACWGLDYMPESRTLDQHIAKLRKKIEQEPEEFIETVRGVGYRWRGA
jgi:DNA-binding response OmpR family regulator